MSKKSLSVLRHHRHKTVVIINRIWMYSYHVYLKKKELCFWNVVAFV
jgi:hypothetical protein